MPDEELKNQLDDPEGGHAGYAFKRAVQKAVGSGSSSVQSASSVTLLQTTDIAAGNTAKLLTVTLAVAARSAIVVHTNLGVDGYSTNTTYQVDLYIGTTLVEAQGALASNTYKIIAANYTSVVDAGSITINVYARALANNWHIAGTVGTNHVNTTNPELYNAVSIVAIPV